MAEVEPFLTGGNYDLRITEAVNEAFVGHAITAPTTNLVRTRTVTVENPTPPTNVPVWWQGTPPSIYLAQAADGVTNKYERNSYVPAGPWATPAPNESVEGAFINAKDSVAAAGRPESFGAETVQANPPLTGWPYPSTPSAQLRGTGPETYSEFPNQNHASTLSPPGLLTFTLLAPDNIASGGGTQLLTCTGTNFTPQSKIVVNGVTQTTTFVSSTSLTATVTKKATAGTWPVLIQTAGVNSASRTWTFT